MVEGKRFFVHILLLENFVGPRPDGFLGLHKDGNKDNNFLENLYWGSPSDNMKDRERHGRGNILNIQPRALPDSVRGDIIRRMILGESPTGISRLHRVSKSTCYKILYRYI
jgi:hypothetical protein